jgi:hypothetical protein
LIEKEKQLIDITNQLKNDFKISDIDRKIVQNEIFVKTKKLEFL